MELRHYTNVLLRWWWLIAASTIVALLASYLGTRAMPRTYRASTTLMVGQALQSLNPSPTEFSTGEALARSYADLAKREPVLKATLETLGLKWQWTVLRDMVSAKGVLGTQLIELSVIDTDPQRAKVLADEVAHQLILQSPSASDPQKEAERKFVTSQVQDLKENIRKSQEEMRTLDDVIAKASSARQIEDAHARQSELQAQISAWQGTYAQLATNLEGGSPNFLRVVEPALIPWTPIGPRMSLNLLMAGAIGFGLAAAAAFFLEYLDDTIKAPEEVQRVLGLATLGSIGRFGEEADSYPGMLVASHSPRSSVAESYRVLRTNLQFSADGHPLRTVLVTSSTPLEGKSVLAANLAVAMAQAGKRVIMVDADLRRPTQHLILEVDNELGLSSALQQDLALSELLQPGSVDNLRILPAGPEPESPPELLDSPRMGEVIEALRQEADLIVLDSPPVMAAADAAILAARLDGTLLVVDSGKTRRRLAQRSLEALKAVGAQLVGVALNRVPATSESRLYDYYSGEGDSPLLESIARLLSPEGGDGAEEPSGTEATSQPAGVLAHEEPLEAVVPVGEGQTREV